MATLKTIVAEHQHDPHKCLIGMLEVWLKRLKPPPTWSAITEAVEFLGEEQLAQQLRDITYESLVLFWLLVFWFTKLVLVLAIVILHLRSEKVLVILDSFSSNCLDLSTMNPFKLLKPIQLTLKYLN